MINLKPSSHENGALLSRRCDEKEPCIVNRNYLTRLADRIPNARLLSISDGGHMLLGHDEEVKAEISKFLGRSVV
ncbi:Uncharacterised protein [uncultured archaeon]|nr:Uncharacterised protein [uncultured archaeon]